MKLIIYLLLIIAPLFGTDDPIVYLTWQNSPQTTMSIQWITSSDHEETALEYYAENETKQFQSGTFEKIPGDHSFALHRVHLSDLTPNTVYTFKLSPEGKPYQFRTVPDVLNESISFVQGGDMYYKSIASMEEISHQAASTNPYFALLGGDLADGAKYEGSEEVRHWLDWLISWEKCMQTPDGLLIPIVTAIGNHEVKGKYHQTPGEAQLFYFLFPTTESTYFALDFGNYMSLLILDSGHTSEVDGIQSEWLKSALERRTHVPYKFAAYHVPAYPAAILKKPDLIGEQVYQCWVPLFEEFGLTAAFEHHSHCYKRTVPLNGVIYLGEGGWGAERMPPIHTPESLWYLAKSASKRHFILVTLDQQKCSYQALDEEGNIIDELLK